MSKKSEKRPSRRSASKDATLKKLGKAVGKVVGMKNSKGSKGAVSAKWRAAALKAWRTRRARAAQEPAISRASAQANAFAPLNLSKNREARLLVVRLLRAGIGPDILAKATGLKRKTLAAYRAHETMGTYRDSELQEGAILNTAQHLKELKVIGFAWDDSGKRLRAFGNA